MPGRHARRVDQAVDALHDLDAAEALRRDVAGALSRRVLSASARPGGSTFRGKAAKHLRLAGQTLVVRAGPAVVADLVSAAVDASARGRFVRSEDLEPGEVVAWEATSMFGPFPRLVVRESPLSHGALVQGATEFGATRIRMSMRFPQSGPFVDRGVAAARDALTAHGVAWTEVLRRFEPDPEVRHDGDGTWLVGDPVPPDGVLP